MAGHWVGARTPHGFGLAGFRFPPDLIPAAVRWHLRYGLSHRDAGNWWPGAA
jgi:transposase-like protein